MNHEEEKFQFGTVSAIGMAIVVAFIAIMLTATYQSPRNSGVSYIDILPTRYSVVRDYDIPITAIHSDDSSWASALASLLTMTFKKQGVSREALTVTDYIEFDEQYLVNLFDKKCNNSQTKACLKYKEKTPFPATALPSLLSQFTEDELKAIPIKPLTKENPFKFRVGKPTFARTVREIKNLIFTTNRPLLLTMPALAADFGGELYTTLLANGNFYVPQQPARPILGKQLNFVLVGYSDHYTVAGSLHHFKALGLPSGGFIVRGYDGPDLGNSIGAYQNMNSDTRLTHFCLNTRFTPSWKTCNESTCESSSAYLDCINSSYCNKDHTYYFKSPTYFTKEAIVTELDTGLTSTLITDATTNTDINYDALPFWELGTAFRPQMFEIVESTDQMCGYWFVPYDYVDLADSMSVKDSDGVIAVDIPILFESTAYKSKVLEREDIKSQIKQFNGYGRR